MVLTILTALEFAAKAMEYASKAIAAGKDAVVIGEFLKKNLVLVKQMHAEERGPTDEEWATLNAEIETNHEDIQRG